MHISRIGVFLLVCAPGMCSTQNIAQGDPEHSVEIIYQAVVTKPGSAVPEISTADLEQILQDQSAVVLDARPFLEWSVSHIPGALNVAPKPGVPIALYTSDVSEIGRLVDGNKSQPLVLYCNGPNCGKSKRSSSAARPSASATGASQPTVLAARIISLKRAESFRWG